ncbi:MAG: low molecular weight protein arginine phosphatase [Firmicutes bacterium]|nr:low molecular weight protein arginine phosphatase [Bacillota bacterium]
METKKPKMTTTTKKVTKKTVKKAIPKTKVLFVCTGNTCRSPMLEFCFKSFLKQKKILSKFDIKSAGIMAIESDLTSQNAIIALKTHNITCSQKNARLLDQNLMKKSDYIICMTTNHKAFIEKDFAKSSVKIMTIGEALSGADIPDPYGLGVDEYCAVLEYFIYICEDILKLINIKGDKDGN